MGVQPKDWSVVVVGAWNQAILTPDGIRKRLLHLPDGTPIQIEVAIDQPGSFRVVHDEVIVSPSPGKLDLVAQTQSLAALCKAAQMGKAAILSLPETPFAAVGINIRYEFDEIPANIYDLVAAPIDDIFSDASFKINGAILQRSLDFESGLINVNLTHENNTGSLVMNFHRASTQSNELVTWIDKVETFYQESQKIKTLLGLQLTEKEYEIET